MGDFYNQVTHFIPDFACKVTHFYPNNKSYRMFFLSIILKKHKNHMTECHIHRFEQDDPFGKIPHLFI